jgi:hypothetical protein
MRYSENLYYVRSVFQNTSRGDGSLPAPRLRRSLCRRIERPLPTRSPVTIATMAIASRSGLEKIAERYFAMPLGATVTRGEGTTPYPAASPYWKMLWVLMCTSLAFSCISGRVGAIKSGNFAGWTLPVRPRFLSLRGFWWGSRARARDVST